MYLSHNLIVSPRNAAHCSLSAHPESDGCGKTRLCTRFNLSTPIVLNFKEHINPSCQTSSPALNSNVHTLLTLSVNEICPPLAAIVAESIRLRACSAFLPAPVFTFVYASVCPLEQPLRIVCAFGYIRARARKGACIELMSSRHPK